MTTKPNLLDTLPRYRLARLPTPLHEASRLREALGGPARCPRLFLKRDDLTDLALGGNKARKLEWLLGDALRQDATVLVTTGAVQSNHARMTAAAAVQAGLRCVLVLTAESASPEVQGNLLLDHLLGADIHFVDAAAGEAAEAAKVQKVMDRLAAAGESPYPIVLGGSDRIGTLGYVDATRELLEHCEEQGIAPAFLYYASGSRGTQAGLELGARVYNAPWRCVGVAVSGGDPEKTARAARMANEAAQLLGVNVALDPAELVTEQDYYGTGYAEPTEGATEAIRLLARAEGIFLDPVYTAKAMAGLLDHIRTGRIAPDQTVVFLHTGGVPGLFGHARRTEAMLAEAPAARG